MLNIKENYNNVEEFNMLYDSVGWGRYEDRIVKKALENTFYSVSVYDEDKIVGFGRIIGDTICFLYIQDIMVMPEYQGKEIGTLIMNKLLEKVKEVKSENLDVRVYLGASKDRESFYERFGFVKREDLELGAGMVLKF